MLKRRAILAALTTSIAAALVPSSVFAARPGAAASLREQFQALLGRNFDLEDANGITSRARLIALDDGPRCQGLEQFSIVFEGEDLTEGIHDVFHPAMGNMSVNLMSSECSYASSTRTRAHFSLLDSDVFGRSA